MKVLLDHGADVNAKETLRGTTPLMWAADEGHAAGDSAPDPARRGHQGASNPARARTGPALGKANDPRKQVAAQGAALAAGQCSGAAGHSAPRLMVQLLPSGAASAGQRGGRAARCRRTWWSAEPRRQQADAADGADQNDDAAAAVGFGGGRRTPGT